MIHHLMSSMSQITYFEKVIFFIRLVTSLEILCCHFVLLKKARCFSLLAERRVIFTYANQKAVSHFTNCACKVNKRTQTLCDKSLKGELIKICY